MNTRSVYGLGPNNLFMVANRHIAIIGNPQHTNIPDYLPASMPPASTGFDLGAMAIITDAVETTVVDNGYGLFIDPYSLREETKILPENDVIHFTSQHYTPDTHTYTGFRLAGTVNDNQQYSIVLSSSGVYHNHTPYEHRMPIISTVNTGIGWTPAQLIAYLTYNLIYDRRQKKFPHDNITPYYEVALLDGTEIGNLNSLSNTYKTTPTSANYNAVLAQWNTAVANFNTAFAPFVANPTLLNANALGLARPYLVVKSKQSNDVVTIGFKDYFDDINNTVTIQTYLPETGTSATALIKGFFGAGTPLLGQQYCNTQTNLYPFSEAFPYCKVLPNGEYGELHFRYNQAQRSRGLSGQNKLMMDLTIFVRMQQDANPLTYYIDNGTGGPETGTITNIATFNIFVGLLTGQFPYLTA